MGEINADDDDWLLDEKNQQDERFPYIIEQRYGFEEKLSHLKKWMSPRGKIFLFEPFKDKAIYQGIERILQQSGWQVTFIDLEYQAPGLKIQIKPKQTG